MKPADTVFKRALDKLNTRTPDEEAFWAEEEAKVLRTVAANLMQENGVVLVGHPSLVEYAIDRACDEIAPYWTPMFQGEPQRKRGRPPVDYNTRSIYAAALVMFAGNGVSNSAAAKQAAQFLGEPATKDRCEKNFNAWRRITSQIVKARGGCQKLRDAFAYSLFTIADDLKSIAAELEAERAAEALRRKSGRHVTFIGATPNASLPKSK
ncbi:hypothetical protein H6M51_12545 [Rhizobium sp. AQ_MP]|uniref:hypothetical protein n=1 Tax=Rhizobium sp. AQ_MP TaxID=2761536 RepID=UPI00163ABCEF|nr:hypothetical protein [Rhizobium sp. AQ_MP]MBC2773695.1 hypothetical protein [Rhizobium sp. AQ_MP]